MMWTALNTLLSLEGKPRDIRVLFADTANAAISAGRTKDEAIFTALAVVKQKERSTIKKYVKPSVPLHLQAILDLKNTPRPSQEELQQLEEANQPKDSLDVGKEVVGAEFDSKGRLTLKFKDGKKIVSNVAPITAVEHSVVVVQTTTGTGTVSTETEGLDELTYSGEDLQRVDYADGAYKLLYWSGGVLQYVDHFQVDQTVRKTLNYTTGILTSVLTEIL
jgi:hypothetical protein